ncbi:MAG: hypothetical protein LBN18_06450 [Dysgonamonadaceae bacterium]|jgi:cell division protein FtsA|nr:hypothetical protein [Dysgonamonadaceae bacterium]
MERNYVAALDIGTSKMIAMVAQKKSGNDKLTISGYKQVESEDCIRRGCIYNIVTTGAKVSSLVADLSRRMDQPIGRIYVSIGGQSLRTQTYSVTREVNGFVNRAITDELDKACDSYLADDDAEVLDRVSREYYTDGTVNPYPVGTNCKTIEERIVLILGNPSLKTCLIKSVEEKAKIEIAGFTITPIATAATVLSDADRDKGCALIELGAGITYVSVYKDKLLRYMVAIPIGSDAITHDIEDLMGVNKQEAEKLKRDFTTSTTEPEDAVETEKRNERLREIINARMNEIIANIIKQLELSGYFECLGTGIILTGGGAALGGAALGNLREILQKQTKNPVLIPFVNQQILFDQVSELTKELAGQPGYATVIGLLRLGKTNCAEDKPIVVSQPETNPTGSVRPTGQGASPVKDPRPRKGSKKSPSLFGRMKNLFDDASSTLYGDEEPTSNQ